MIKVTDERMEGFTAQWATLRAESPEFLIFLRRGPAPGAILGQKAEYQYLVNYSSTRQYLSTKVLVSSNRYNFVGGIVGLRCDSVELELVAH